MWSGCRDSLPARHWQWATSRCPEPDQGAGVVPEVVGAGFEAFSDVEEPAAPASDDDEPSLGVSPDGSFGASFCEGTVERDEPEPRLSVL